MAEQSAENIDQCGECGSTDWDTDGTITCAECGYRPRKDRRDEIAEVVV